MTHDFKEALEYANDILLNNSQLAKSGKDPYHPINTIITALRIADKLMQEPSSKAIRNMINHEFKYNQDHVPAYDIIREEWTVLRDQMLSDLQLTKTD